MWPVWNQRVGWDQLANTWSIRVHNVPEGETLALARAHSDRI
jgi:hypothetical protein